MISRKEEERNEKIIRGLMKLPPNRRCINCNSLGPQYVCTNFWTFVCITCSGIHREFTHRVKSVSMANFTSQEVDALQRGGNQRARETLLKDWDIQRQRLPDSSNVDRVREFVKHVYVDRRYAGGKIADKPPRDTQSLKNNEDETRRASSYHSFSQSPPYEYQYDDRRYGKHGGMLSRKPGSDRGNYEGKISSFVYSPGRLGEQMYEDRFANEGSGSRVSDYSVSNPGDPFRSGTQSPNFQDKVSSPPAYPVRDILVEDKRRQTVSASAEESAKRDSAGIAHTQRNASLGSVRSLDGNSVSLNSVTSGSLLDIASDSNQSTGAWPDGTAPVPFLSESPVSTNGVVSDPFSFQIVQKPATSSIQFVDLFKTPEIPSSRSIDLFSDFTHQPLTVASSEQNPSKVSLPENGGWATFDIPQHEASIPQVKTAPPPTMPSGGVNFSANSSMQSPSVSYQSNEASISQMMNVPLASMPHGDVHSSANSSMQWPSVSYTSHSLFLTVDNQWHENSHEFQASSGSTGKPWNAFEDASANIPQPSYQNLPYTSNPQVVEYNHPSNTFDKPPSTGDLSAKVPEGEMSLHANDWKSTNPFDLPFDSVFEPDAGLPNMNSLQAALPDSQLPPAYVSGLTQPWFPPNTTPPYIQTTPQGGLPFMVGEATAPQLPNIPSQSPVTSLGGNPFA